MRALIEIVVEPRLLEKVCKEISKLENAVRVYEITGEFDVFVELEVSSMDELRRILKEKILKVSGVKTTHSSVVLGEWKSQ